jgi:hypothetical protein
MPKSAVMYNCGRPAACLLWYPLAMWGHVGMYLLLHKAFRTFQKLGGAYRPAAAGRPPGAGGVRLRQVRRAKKSVGAVRFCVFNLDWTGGEEEGLLGEVKVPDRRGGLWGGGGKA